MLRNRVYLGELAYGLDRRFVNAEAHEPIVDLPAWEAAQQPSSRRLAPARSAGSQFLLTGIARCAACRYSLQATTSSRGKRIYRCTRTHSGGICPEPARVYAEPVEQAAVEAFWALTDDLEAEGREDNSGKVALREAALQRAERALEQWASTKVQETIGDLGIYTDGLRERRTARDTAALELERVRPRTADLPDAQTLRTAWERMTAQERRELLALRFDCLALRRDRSIVVYPAGTGPTELPRRGFTRAPEQAPFPDPPDGARLLALEEAGEPAGDGDV
jgi:hypothetical protein